MDVFWFLLGIFVLCIECYFLGYVYHDYKESLDLIKSRLPDDSFILEDISISDIKSDNPFVRRTNFKE